MELNLKGGRRQSFYLPKSSSVSAEAKMATSTMSSFVRCPVAQLWDPQRHEHLVRRNDATRLARTRYVRVVDDICAVMLVPPWLQPSTC